MGAGSSAAGPSRIIKLPDGLDDVSDSEIGSGSSTSIDSENPTEDEKAKNKFTVEYFTEARPDGEGGWLYNVKWYRYKDNEKNNTWEPSYSLKACRLLMRSFWEHVGRERSDSSIYHEDNPIIPTDEWKQECAKLLVEALQTKGRARYGREHSGFTPEPPAERKKKKRGRARMIISDSDSGGARSGPAKGKSKGKSRASIQDSAQARKYQPHPKKRGLGSSSGSGGESFQGGARIAKKPPKKKAKTKAGSPGPSRDGTANSAMPLTKTALQPLPNLITKRQRADSESSEEVPLTTMVPATSEQLIQDRRDSARSQSAASSKSTPVPRVISLPREATGPAIPSSSPPPKIVKTSNEIQMRQSLDPPPSPPGTVPASTPSLPVAPLPPPAGQAATPTAVTHNTPAAPAIPIQPAVTLNQKVDKHRGSQIKLVPTRFHPVSSLTTKASIAGVLSPALSVTTANSTNVPAIDPQVSPTPEDAANTTTNPLSELVPLRPLPSLSILNDNSKDDYRVVDSPVTLSPTSSIETPLSASMKKFPSNRTRKSAMDVVDEASKSFGAPRVYPPYP
ncbi:uncharacterized protein EI90DRAFT_5917 [Cantharellus anzutake]|uniref:uncharacterized protein n=1 Tax=Cantharellus anzutake TaxID=1750568 RepID=UPI001907DFDF|nr:uncharacterized protein EI90DRAFT_5917 [Cantharellus anzutake]KAF8343799.1 hypothetical protein EI90DRAFT_5917 [Cantharellus anzutake]